MPPKHNSRSASVSALSFAPKPKVVSPSKFFGSPSAQASSKKGEYKKQSSHKGGKKPSYKSSYKGSGGYGSGSYQRKSEEDKKADDRARYEESVANAKVIANFELGEGPKGNNRVRVEVNEIDGKVRKRYACTDCSAPPDRVFVRARFRCCDRFFCSVCFRGHLDRSVVCRSASTSASSSSEKKETGSTPRKGSV